MAREFAKDFYNSELWQSTRKYVLMRDSYKCQAKGCDRAASDVHHIKWLTPDNINDYNIAVNPDNLISLCWDCHREIHRRKDSEDYPYTFDENGMLVPIPPGRIV